MDASDLIFVSYARADERRVHWVTDNLVVAGYRVFLDRSLAVSSSWETIISRKISDCSCFVLVLSSSNDAKDGGWVDREIREAIALGKRIVPVRIDRVDPPQVVSHLNVADLSGWKGNSTHTEWRKTLAAIGGVRRGRLPLEPARLAAVARIKAVDLAHVADNQGNTAPQGDRSKSIKVASSSLVVIQVHAQEDFTRKVVEFQKSGFLIADLQDGLAELEKTRSMPVAVLWVLAIIALLLALFSVIACLVFNIVVLAVGWAFFKTQARVPATERIRVVYLGD